jgi:COMPASS component SWD3
VNRDLMTMDSLSEFNPRDDLADAPQFSLAKTLSGHNDSVPAVKFSQDGSKIASGSSDCTAKIWDVENGKMINNLSQHAHGISDVGWNWDGVTLATASDDHSAKLWDIRSPRKAIRVLEGHTHHVTSCSFSLSGNMIVTGSFDETMRLWDVRNGKCIGTIPAHGDPIMSVQFSTESSTPVIASASLDGCWYALFCLLCMQDLEYYRISNSSSSRIA